MSINTNHTQESIAPESGVLTIDATGALALPSGGQIDRPLGAAAGHIRFDQTETKPEYFDGTVWENLVALSYVNTQDQNLQNQINNILSNIDPAALDSLTEIVKAFQDADGDFAGALNSLTTNLNNSLNAEALARANADTLLQDNIDTEAQTRLTNDDTLQDNIDAEQARAVAAELDLQNKIDNIISNLDPVALDSLTEIVAAFQNSDSDLVATINNLIIQSSNDLAAEALTRANADTLLQANLDAEALTRLTNDDTLQDNIDAEAQTRANADTLLQSNLDTEAQTRANADTLLQSNLDTEAQTRANADTLLQSNLDAEALTRLTNDDTLQDNIDAEAQTRLDADTLLQSNLDTETQNRISAVSAIQTSITTEYDRAVAAELILTNGLAAEIARATGVEADLQTDLTAEVGRATNAEQTLQDNIDNLSLDSLTDVIISAPTSGQVLSYDLDAGQFRNQTQTFTANTKNFIGDGITLSYDIETAVSSPHLLSVSVSGIQQDPFYSYNLVDGHIVLFDEAPANGDRIQIKILKSTVTSDRPRPTVTGVSYSTLSGYTTISITATDVTFGTGARIGDLNITRIDYPTANIMQLMIETPLMALPMWGSPQDLTLIDTSGNEFVFTNLINYGQSKPYWTKSTSYIGAFSSGDTINFTLGVNNTTSIAIEPANAGETSLNWLSISGTHIVGTAPQNSSPSRYELKVTASNGSVNITKNFWLLVL
jgi:hypothetical protein